MFLEQLRDFEWYNEPADVSFDERGMRVLSRARTDFWQSLHHRFSKDDGHFFSRAKPAIFPAPSNGILKPTAVLTNAALCSV